jgi:hypothetical protein
MLLKSQYRQLPELAFRRDAKTKKIIRVQANLSLFRGKVQVISRLVRLPGRICIKNTDAEEEQRDVSERERRHQQDLQVLLRRDSLNKALDGVPDRAGGDANGGRRGGGGEGEDAEAAELQKKLGLLEEQVGMLCSSVLCSSMLSVCPQYHCMCPEVLQVCTGWDAR